ncbi:hypothetical protein DOT_5949 [Desulfosporosinus sp. OT]|nr:hypothetical protein DOT_5949 [Desulfosporosinus sp. OT]
MFLRTEFPLKVLSDTRQVWWIWRDIINNSWELSSIIPTLSQNNFTEVRGITISDFLTEYDVKDIGFIKIDIEGGEYSIIPSMHDYLCSNRPTLLLYISFHSFRLSEEIKIKNSKNNSDSQIYLEDSIYQVFKSLDF